ncbi:MAG: AAA family ATPase, partial [Oscillospiraceae bacterium]
MGVAIVITSGKGGTGKTSFTGGVGSCLAALGHRVLCIDMDIGLRNLDLTLGMTDRALMDFTDVLSGRCTLERAAVQHPVVKGLYLLTA